MSVNEYNSCRPFECHNWAWNSRPLWKCCYPLLTLQPAIKFSIAIIRHEQFIASAYSHVDQLPFGTFNTHICCYYITHTGHSSVHLSRFPHPAWSPYKVCVPWAKMSLWQASEFGFSTPNCTLERFFNSVHHWFRSFNQTDSTERLCNSSFLLLLLRPVELPYMLMLSNHGIP